MNRRFLKKLDKSIGISKLKNQITTINLMLIFLVVVGIYAIILNHQGAMLSYGIIVASVSMIVLALFLSYRIKQQVKLNGIHLDYRKVLVEPAIEHAYEAGRFSRAGSLTEREILATYMFSDSYEYKYDSRNEAKGTYKGINFATSDVRMTKDHTKMTTFGRIFTFDIPTPNINPVVFVSSTAPDLFFTKVNLNTITMQRPEIEKRFKTYAFDSHDAQNMDTSAMEFKLESIAKLGLGRIYKISYYNGRVSVYYTTEGYSFPETLTKKEITKEEVAKTIETMSIVDKLIDILK